MDDLYPLRNEEQLRVLSDPRRLDILRRLMSAPATLTQLGRQLGEHPAWVRHHLKRLEAAGLVELVSTEVVGGHVEKHYRARARAFLRHEIILPAEYGPRTLFLLGSHDLALEILADLVAEQTKELSLFPIAVGSLEGLVALHQGLTPLTGSHLLDVASGEFNAPYVRHLLPDQVTSLITLAERQQGLLVQPDNPLGITGLADLGRPEVRLINRNRGSGTRLWLDRILRELGLPPDQITGYAQEGSSHSAVAQAILERRADVGLALQAAAHRCGLDFIPLFTERYDLVIPQSRLNDPSISLILETLATPDFRRKAGALAGYSILHTGESRCVAC